MPARFPVTEDIGKLAPFDEQPRAVGERMSTATAESAIDGQSRMTAEHALSGPAGLAAIGVDPPPEEVAEAMLPALDHESLRILADAVGDDGLSQIVSVFCAETEARLERRRADATDPETLDREIHTLKGAAGTVSAKRQEYLSRVIEPRLRQGQALRDDDGPDQSEAFIAWRHAVDQRIPNCRQCGLIPAAPGGLSRTM